MANNQIVRSIAKQRLKSWKKSNQTYDLSKAIANSGQVDEFPEGGLLDKAKVKLLSKPAKKKEKIWLLECKWNSNADYEKYVRTLWRRRQPYTTKWWPAPSTHKFTTLAGARDNFKTRRAQTYHDEVSGRKWRIRNIKTGTTHLLP